MFPSWVKTSVFFDLRFGFLVKNCIYGQILVKIGQNPVKLIKQLKIFINLNLGLDECAGNLVRSAVNTREQFRFYIKKIGFKTLVFLCNFGPWMV